MNQKDMTNMQLVEAIKDQRFSLVDETKELLRRLNERDQYKIQWENCNSDFHFAVEQADALRKENEELRKDKERIDFLDDGNYGIDPRNIPGVMMNGRRFHCLAGRGDWSSLRDAIDAARLAKESEASHE